ncbi:MAG TPA: GNAT family N-acetyltransferase, partial [Catenuloplanes sp.]
MTPETIEGPGVRLRPFRAGDADDVVGGCADPVTQRSIPTMPHPYTHDTARWWIADGAPAVFAA